MLLKIYKLWTHYQVYTLPCHYAVQEGIIVSELRHYLKCC